jgi:hypothetical protein
MCPRDHPLRIHDEQRGKPPFVLRVHWEHEPSHRAGAPQQRAADVSSAVPSFFLPARCRQHADHEPSAKRVGAQASWTAATESSESPLWIRLAVSAASFGILNPARAKAVTSRTPSPHSKTWRRIRRFMEGTRSLRKLPRAAAGAAHTAALLPKQFQSHPTPPVPCATRFGRLAFTECERGKS